MESIPLNEQVTVSGSSTEPDSRLKDEPYTENNPSVIPLNYPKLGSGNKYYKKLDKYCNEDGLAFKYNKEIRIEKMKDLLKTDITLVGKCVFNSRENTPLRYTKGGVPCKNNKQVIDSENFEGVLVKFASVNDTMWNNKNTEGIYFITFNEFIVKIGMTEKSFCDRFQSYCCGYRKTMNTGTPSTTNFIICEVCYTALLLGIDINIYGMTIPKEKKEIEAYGRKSIVPVSVIRGHEEIITQIYKDTNNTIPPLCVQHASNTNL